MQEICAKLKILLAKSDNLQLTKNVIGNYVIKGGSMLIALFLTPAYMNYFYSQKLLGMWYTTISLLSWIMLFDFGIGGGIRNELVQPLLEHDNKKLKEILSAGYFSIGAVILFLIFAQHFIINAINWYPILGVTKEEISPYTLYTLLHILVVGILLRLFSVLIGHVFYAMQKATLPSLLTLCCDALVLLYVMVNKPTGSETDIIKLALVYVCAMNVPSIVAAILLFATALRKAVPNACYIKKTMLKKIWGAGTGLFYLQILITLVFGVKDLFITWFVGTEEVVDYHIYYKLIGVVGSLFSVALTPIWSAVTKAHVSKDYIRLQKLYTMGERVIGLLSIMQFVLLAAMPILVKIWLGKNAIEVSYIYGAIFCIYNSLYMWIMMNYNFACGLGRIKRLFISLLVAFILNTVLAYCLCKVIRSWIAVITASIFSILPAAVWISQDIRGVFLQADGKN